MRVRFFDMALRLAQRVCFKLGPPKAAEKKKKTTYTCAFAESTLEKKKKSVRIKGKDGDVWVEGEER